jgi:hypothetical protein
MLKAGQIIVLKTPISALKITVEIIIVFQVFNLMLIIGLVFVLEEIEIL